MTRNDLALILHNSLRHVGAGLVALSFVAVIFAAVFGPRLYIFVGLAGATAGATCWIATRSAVYILAARQRGEVEEVPWSVCRLCLVTGVTSAGCVALALAGILKH